MSSETDGEAALLAFQDEVQKKRCEETLLQNSPVGDSEENGRAEGAVQAISEPVRALNAGLRGEDSNDNSMGVLCNFAEEVPLWGGWEDSSSQTEDNTVETSDGCFFLRGRGGRRG